MVAISASNVDLQGSSLLGLVDRLFACGASKYVEIPQIVAVGDQSSGKSSVLSSMMEKSLPRDASLCTRFPTKIIFRPADESRVRIRLIPDPKGTSERQKYIQSIKSWSAPSFDELDLEETIREVSSKVGIKGPDDVSGTGTTFCTDILEITIEGPDKQHLSIIDVPGIFRDTEAGKTTPGDKDLVRGMVEDYMSSSRSVMLVVIPANVDLATQEILAMANEVDPEGDRTIGVLTKPDLVDEGAEAPVIELLQGRKRPLKLGWHVVQNAGQKALNGDVGGLDFLDRKQPWALLDPSLRGHTALTVRIRDVLSDLVDKQFVNVKADIDRNLREKQQSQRDLGPHRDSRLAQAAFLTDLSTKFQDLVRNGLSSRFGGSNVFEAHPQLMLAPLIVERMHQFRADMTAWGHVYSFSSVAQESFVKQPASYLQASPAVRKVRKNLKTGTTDSLICFRRSEDFIGFSDMLVAGRIDFDPEIGTSTAWIQKVYRDNRGFELGTFDPAILATAMREQTVRWPTISLAYTSDILIIIYNFIMTALKAVCKNSRLEAMLYNHLEAKIRKRCQRAVDQVKFILNVELHGLPWTLHDDFGSVLQTRRSSRFNDMFKELNLKPQDYSKESHRFPIGNEPYIVQEIGDITWAYYEVARNRFIDTICKQATDHFLVTGPDTPLTVFSPLHVSQMTDAELESIAGEDAKTKRTRAQLNNEINDLMNIRKEISLH